MKLAALVILYHPPENVLDNIASYYDKVERLYVFDNTESTSCQSWFTGFEKVVFIYDGENKGIATRLNEGCALAIKDGYDWLLTMDQDSRFPAGTFATYQHCICQQPNLKLTAAFGIKYKDYEMPPVRTCEPKPTPFIITSGMLLNLAVTTAIGGFDDQLFIDGVDHEYCLRANLRGYPTIKFDNLSLHHTVGVIKKRASIKTLYLIKKVKEIHSPLRCYYMHRNALYINRKYGKVSPKDMVLFNKIVKGNLSRNLWYGRYMWQFLRYMLKARTDFRKGKMGKITGM